ncbi:uncharacterized protein LOC126687786 [Mercurialis annua]|uniref:uncharacterized protein LOC126687786 n=1 Tax=Mercurialis annua TaxID=3986 RepID=UPI002160A335|nr:uncharacterized protein LOC126687786 [Mercurialis annua]
MKESLWAKWIIKNKLKMLSFWGITKPLIASWSWRNLCKIRQDIKGCFSCELGRGDLSFWFDPWFQGKAIIDQFPSMSFIDDDVPREAKVRDVWRRGAWRLPDPGDDMTESVWDTIKTQFRINDDREDTVKWILNRDGAFTISSAWKHFRVNHEKVPWWKVIWSPSFVPIQSFIAWLAVRKKLKTRDKLKKLACVEEDRCVLCNEESESIEHLFFNCKCTKAVMNKLLNNCNIHRKVGSWRREWSWFIEKTREKRLLARVRRIAFIAAIYHIWRARNKVIFKKVAVIDVEILRMIRKDVMLNLYGRHSNTSLFV